LIIPDRSLIRFLKYLKDSLVYIRSDLHYRLRSIFPTKLIAGVRLSINDDDVLSRDLVMSVLQGGYENLENRVIRNNLSSNERVLELGTGIGFNAIAAARINGNKVLSYELNSGLQKIILKNQELNRVRFEVRNKMLVCNLQTTGPTEFYVARNACMSSTVSDQLPGFELLEKRKVSTESFETVLAEWRPEFLIVDIEGGELALFECCEVLRNSSVNKILLEIHAAIIGKKAADDLLDRIRHAGFSIIKDQCVDEVFFFKRR